MTYPLIITAGLDDEAQRRLDSLREQWFPPGRTVVGAHLTLFHAIPASQRDMVLASVAALGVETCAFDVWLPELRSLGRGVAVRVESAQLLALRKQVAAPLQGRLTAQDAQGFRPHITLANKLSAAEAKKLLKHLRATWMPAKIRIEGLMVWSYIGPQWRLERRVAFVKGGVFSSAPARR